MMDDLTLVVKAIDSDNNEYTITMDPTNFVWQSNEVHQADNY